MSKVNSKIKFYSFGSEKIDFSKIDNMLDLDTSKPVLVSKGFNKALRSVIEKDINFLSRKINDIVTNITKALSANNISPGKMDSDIKNIDLLINEIESLISYVIIEKENIKVSIFSSNKKDKKKKTKDLEELLSLLSKYETELIAIKNEYNKLSERKNVIKIVENDVQEDSSDDPLERTINFYLNKQKNN